MVLSLRIRLILLLIGAAIPVVGVMAVAVYQGRQIVAAQIQDRALRSATSARTEEQEAIDGARQTLTVLAQLPILREENPVACSTALADLLSRQRLRFANIGLAGPDGRVTCSAIPVRDGVSLADEPYFQQVISSRDSAVGRHRVGPTTDQAQVDIGYPVLTQSATVGGIAFASMDLSWLREVVDEVQPLGGSVTLVDPAGTVLASYPPVDRWATTPDADAPTVRSMLGGQPGAKLVGIGPDGSPYLYGAALLHDGSYVRVGLPEGLATSQQQGLLTMASIGFGGAGLLAILAAWLIGELAVLRPVRSLVGVARRLGTGDLTATTSVSRTKGELGEIARAFDHAASELRAREEQIRQAQKLEALGLMAGGIAHDFNNLVTGVIGFSGLVLARLPANDPLRTFVLQIEAAGQRAANLTRQLLAFSRRQALQPQVLDLNGVVADLEGLLRRALGEQVELLASFEPELAHIEADRGQIEQVLVNLAVNARDAMPDGGKLTIKTANVVLGEEYARQHAGAQVGHHAMLSVTDTGMGMDEETQKRIFEPFFTTKEPGKGTGLGLSTVYGIVNQSGGSVWVYSELGHGTTFRIYLPRVDKPITAIGARESSDGLPGGKETILLVEDDKIVRSFTTTVLESLGYNVLVAAGAHDALPVISSRGNNIDLLITDLVMPGMGGRELGQLVAAHYPGIRILYMSGFDPETQVGQRAVPYGAPFLQKPFSPATLSQKIREALRP